MLGQNVTAKSANGGGNAKLFGAGFNLEVSQNTVFFVSYNREIRDAREGKNILGGIQVNW